MSADIKEVFKNNEIIRILKYKMEKSRRDPLDEELYGRVRRKLTFGEPDPFLQSVGAVRRELAFIAEKNRTKWNFDFEKDRSEDGRYSWEPVKRAKNGYPVQKRITEFLGKRKNFPFPPESNCEAEKENEEAVVPTLKKGRLPTDGSCVVYPLDEVED
ncbi:uncharacterized protein LOC106669997 [Cimex lectularius]|uniref:Cyclin-dependent kinase inhibitor domain-containing protein n=1 Tax=Cimex lectularius TaxID=79782 RepID=A0A8I6TJG3_CIMLE|nr:uncharacterized protein LOC106669997 [Cimex lectularius]